VAGGDVKGVQMSRTTIDASLGVGMVGGVKALYAVLLVLVPGMGCMSTDQRNIIKLGEAAIERHGEVTDILRNPTKK
jgi:hypothetical protein